MPNWTEVRLCVIGELHDLQALAETGLSLDKMVPTSIDPEKTLRERRIDAWGVKWDADKVEFSMCNMTCCIHAKFFTPWEHPLQAYLTFSASHLSLEFDMLWIGDGGGAGDVGRVVFKAGVVIRKTELDF